MDDVARYTEELNRLKERQHDYAMQLAVLKESSEHRHQTILEKIDQLYEFNSAISVKFNKEMSIVIEKIESLQDLANQGKTSLKTLWFIGGLVASILAFIATWAELIK